MTREFLEWLPANDDPAQVRRSDVERYLDWYAAISGAKPASLRNRCLSIRASKTESGIRTITLLAEMVKELDDWERFCRERGLYRAGGYVLGTRTGKPMAPQFAWRLVKRVATRAGARVQEATDKAGVNTAAISAHTFRRTLATDLLNRGVRLEVVSGELGHNDTRPTLEHYAQMQDAVRRAEVLRAYGEQA